MYKYGIISTASITKRFIDGLRLAGDEVICIGSRDINKSKEFALANSIDRYYGSYDEVYEDDEVDIIYIPVINNLHFDCAKKALEHHKHVVLEKPFTITSNEAKELFRLAKENNCFIFEAVKNIFVPSTKFVVEHLPLIGKVINITTTQGIKNPFPEGHWMYDISQGGGAYIGSCSYFFHYLRYLFNSEITEVDGTYIPCFNSDMSCDVNYKLGDIKVNSKIDMSKDLDDACVINGENGKIIIDVFWRSHHVLVKTSDDKTYEFNDEGNEFVYETKHIQDCISKGLIESPLIKEIDTVKEIENIELIYKKWNLM